MSKNKTRTKDKYRVVYNDTQRIELENEFRLNEYIAIPRKQEIAQKLQLSERQIKIWFQNRRAKKRKQQKRRQTTNNNNISTPPYSGYLPGNPTCTKDNTPPTTSLINIKSDPDIMSPTGHLQDSTYQDHATAASIIPSSQKHLSQYHEVQQQHQQQQHQLVVDQAAATINNDTNNNHSNSNINSMNNNTGIGNASYYQDAAAAVAANQECHQEYYNMIHHHHHHHHQQQHQHQQQQQQQQQQLTRPLDPFTLPQHSHHNQHSQHSHHPSSIHHSQQTSDTVAASAAAVSQCWPSLNQSTPPHVATSPAVMNHFHLENHTTHQIGPALQAPVSPYADHANTTSTYTNGYQTQHQHYVPNQHTCNAVYYNPQHHFKA